jgi:hypothetical protein
VSRESWQSRLLSGLSGLGGWLVGPDPGLNRLRTVLCATLTIAGAIGAEWLFVRFTGALQRPAPPAAAGAAAVAQVAAVNRAVVILAMVLGGVAGLMAAISVNDTSPRDPCSMTPAGGPCDGPSGPGSPRRPWSSTASSPIPPGRPPTPPRPKAISRSATSC